MTNPGKNDNPFSSPMTPQNPEDRREEDGSPQVFDPSHTPTAVYPPSNTPFVTARNADARQELERRRSEDQTQEAENVPLPGEYATLTDEETQTNAARIADSRPLAALTNPYLQMTRELADSQQAAERRYELTMQAQQEEADSQGLAADRALEQQSLLADQHRLALQQVAEQQHLAL